MTTGTDTEDISVARKTVIINNELLRLKVDISALQETRIAGQGAIKENDYKFFWHGKSVDERREHGVGFAIKNALLQSVVTNVLPLFVYTQRKKQQLSSA